MKIRTLVCFAFCAALIGGCTTDAPDSETDCFDAVDNDSDGLTDCDDADCAPRCVRGDGGRLDSALRSDGGGERTDAGIADGCVPRCAGRECGGDGCGGRCGVCEGSTSCNQVLGECQTICTPVCAGRECGSDGCDGLCGTCDGEEECTAERTCECVPSCDGRECGADGCGGICGTCEDEEECSRDGECECVPVCDGRECGPDGCGGVCGTCSGADRCDEERGVCEECVPTCEEGQTCGPDGCGGSCGSCEGSLDCRRCPSGRRCEVETYFCRCDLFSTLAYEFDASDVDWELIRRVELEYIHVDVDGTRNRREGILLTPDMPTHTYRVNGCEPQLEVLERHYYFRDFSTCTAEVETVTTLPVEVPNATRDEIGTCSIPPL